jgi:hypothetical protein
MTETANTSETSVKLYQTTHRNIPVGSRAVQLYNLLKKVVPRNMMHLTEVHVEGCMAITTTDIKPSTERLLKQKQSLISY